MNKICDNDPKLPAVPDCGGDVVEDGNKQGYESLDPNDFLKYLKEHITPSMLISDRVAQARLDNILDSKYYQEDTETSVANYRSKEDKFHNPLPKLILKSKNGGITFIHETIFELKEEDGNRNYYFFETGNPSVEVPSYLRDEDIVPSGRFRESLPDEERRKISNEFNVSDVDIENMIYGSDPRLDEYRTIEDISFNKPLNRVSQYGGAVERYNYRTSSWEIEENCKNYDAPVSKRIAGFVIKIASRAKTPDSQDDKKALR